ncbi:Glycosyl transferase group 1 (fragment) [Candidatus Nitrospira nitrosa]|uniref:Glycosyl transferase group 1 n=1 Tax=Candidatus Nitrospira nitrosa TaxID=1742972 RepID=A0A0S4LAP3_9BACT
MATVSDRPVTAPFMKRFKSRAKVVAIFARGCISYLSHVFRHSTSSSVAMQAASQAMVLSPRLRQLQGMIALSERAYLYWYGKHIFTGRGHIVDLGCWLGSTTISLAMGVEHNPRAPFKTSIYGYDEFIWRSYMDSGVKGTKLEGKYQTGDSFLDEYERRTAQWRRYVVPCPGDLAKGEWYGTPIEFLLIDAMKSWGAATGVVQNFFPALIPEVSLIMHQDFAHWFTSWIHPIHYRFRDYFEPVYDVPLSGSMIFRLSRALPQELLKQEWSVAQFSDEEVDKAFAYSMEIVSCEKRANVHAAKVMYFIHGGQLDRAKQELADAHALGYSFDSDLAIVERRVAEKTGSFKPL